MCTYPDHNNNPDHSIELYTFPELLIPRPGHKSRPKWQNRVTKTAQVACNLQLFHKKIFDTIYGGMQIFPFS